jgi:hypothetical protein
LKKHSISHQLVIALLMLLITAAQDWLIVIRRFIALMKIR